MSILTTSKSSGGMTAKEAATGPHRGAKNKTQAGCLSCLFGVIIWGIILIVIAIVTTTPSKEKTDEMLAQQEAMEKEQVLERQAYQLIYDNLSYLNNNSDFSGYKLSFYNGYKIYITLKNKKNPKNFKNICDSAAKKTSALLMEQKIENTSCNAYLLPENINQGNEDNAIYYSTAKDGQIIYRELTESGEKAVYQSMSPAEQQAYKKQKIAEKNLKEFKERFVDYDGSVRPVVTYVKSVMHAPDSFKHVETNYFSISDSNDQFNVHMTYRGTNALGATVTETVMVEISNTGLILKVNGSF